MLFSQLVVIAAASYLMELKPPLKEDQGAEKPQQPSPYAIKALCVMLYAMYVTPGRHQAAHFPLKSW